MQFSYSGASLCCALSISSHVLVISVFTVYTGTLSTADTHEMFIRVAKVISTYPILG